MVPDSSYFLCIFTFLPLCLWETQIKLGGTFRSQVSDSFKFGSSYRDRWCCSVPHTAEFSVPPRVKIPFPIWTAPSSFWLASLWRIISLFSNKISLTAIFLCLQVFCCALLKKSFICVFYEHLLGSKRKQVDVPLAHASSGWLNSVLSHFLICHVFQPPSWSCKFPAAYKNSLWDAVKSCQNPCALFQIFVWNGVFQGWLVLGFSNSVWQTVELAFIQTCNSALPFPRKPVEDFTVMFVYTLNSYMLWFTYFSDLLCVSVFLFVYLFESS